MNYCAGDQGFEPQYRPPEGRVLPLDESPKLLSNGKLALPLDESPIFVRSLSCV